VNTLFCHDVWAASVPLRTTFPRIFEICENENMTVADTIVVNWQFGLS
jgi:hypothetical protein